MLKAIKSNYALQILIFTVVLYAALLLGLTIKAAAAASGVVTGSVVNIRSGPGTVGYHVIGSIYIDSKVEILAQSGEWYQVQHGNICGWIHQSLLSVTQIVRLQVNEDIVNLRSGPGTTYSIVGKVTRGDLLPLLSMEGEWHKTKTDAGLVAYIRSDMIVQVNSMTIPEGAKPAATNPATDQPTPSGAAATPAAPSQVPNVTMDGRPMSFEVPPIIENGRTLVPLRAIFEAMGAVVEWNESAQTVTATRGSIVVILPLDSTVAAVNGVAWTLDVPAKVIKGRTLAPLRFAGEALGGTVTWDAADFTAHMTSPPSAEIPDWDSQREGLTVSAQRSTDGLKIIMESTQKLETKINKSTGMVSYVFADRQISGSTNLQEYMGTALINVSGSNSGDDAMINIQLPSDIKYQTATENDGKRQVLIIPHYISSVARKTFGNGGENITVNATTPIKYTQTTGSNLLEIVLNNISLGQAQSSYNYASTLISSMGFKNEMIGGQTRTIMTLTTNKAAKFYVGAAGDGSKLNLLFIDRNEVQSRDPIVVLDAGHGGSEPGACGTSLNEKAVNLAVVQKAGQFLTAKGIKVVYTRQDDSYVSLDERTNIANLYNAAVFVSVHSNADTSSSPSGTETYCYYPLENPQLYMQKDERYNLALKLQQALVDRLERLDRGVKEKNLAVLRNSTMPSALVEMAFISNPVEEALLQQDSFRTLAAQAITDAISDYIKAHGIGK